MALTENIVQRTVSGEETNRFELAGGNYARKLAIADDWTKLRVCCRMSFNTTKANGNYNGYPSFYFGMCHGTALPPGMSGTEHFLGIKSNPDSLIVGADYILNVTSRNSSTQSPLPTTIQAGSETNLPYETLGFRTSRSALLLPSFFGMTIEKTSSTGYDVDIYSKSQSTHADFRQGLEDPSGISGFRDTSRSFSMTSDESLYGVLDTACFTFMGEADTWELADLSTYRLA